jgi:uncharacterized protein YegL
VSTGIPRNANIMLVIDNSASITGADRDEVERAIEIVKNQIRPHLAADGTQLGIVEFGTRAGILSSGARIPHVRLTHSATEIQTYSFPGTHTGRTNISQALAVAHAELTGHRYVPGSYEAQIFADTPDFSTLALPPAEVRDRDDSQHPDFIILVTDGSPTMAVSHNTATQGFTREKRNKSGDILTDPISVAFGENYPTSYIAPNEYLQCNDKPIPDRPDGQGYTAFTALTHPDDTLIRPSWYPHVNDYPNNVRCNTSMIADFIKAQGIEIYVVGVGLENTEPIGTSEFLRDRIASSPDYYAETDFINLASMIAQFFVDISYADAR